jgi:hypothetical protein
VIHPLTEETAAAERRRILTDVKFHRNAARRRLRDLEQLEVDCARVGIRLIREPIHQTRQGETDASRTHPHAG